MRIARFFIMLGALLGLSISLIQALVLATTMPQVIMASIGCALSVLIGLLATKEDF
jgi:hypothetical protein